MKFEVEFKEAISLLSSKEKDKLILRLLKKDVILAKRLYFELVSGDSVQDRRADMEERIKKLIVRSKATYYSPGYLLIALRAISADITEHVKVVSDKYGEASLNLLMLNEVLSKNNDVVQKATAKNSYTFYIYIIARAFKILLLIKALHEDFHIEFEDGLKELGNHFKDNRDLTKLAINNRFDPNWLLNAEIPDNIVKILKEVRAAGLLK